MSMNVKEGERKDQDKYGSGTPGDQLVEPS